MESTAKILLFQDLHDFSIFFELFPEAQHHFQEDAVDIGHLREHLPKILVKGIKITEPVEFSIVMKRRWAG